MATNADAVVELESYGQQAEQLGIEQHHAGAIESLEAANGFSLPPTDGGKDAWLFLLAAFALEALVWGMLHARLLIGTKTLIARQASLRATESSKSTTPPMTLQAREIFP
jgi:hypothetical protein